MGAWRKTVLKWEGIGNVRRLFSKVSIPFLGRLPDDIGIEREASRFHFPAVACVIISILLTLILSLLAKKW
ncbi:DUF2905 family protein [bacterium]|nr:DUF2905 family protein [bacterium]